ncbi:DUF58 domain-containing protein [Tepidiforma sp.]|uniref:DUF58 domain-containing protein n=1 Tax=Tepidiforma sp. TaxID=2682230 RepID=UPI002ADDF9BA|nr:DUF58 domain-containing protein [Tepidiforma sp.]
MSGSLAAAWPRTPDRPGPGPMPEGVLRALDVTVGRRVSSLLAGDFRSHGLGTGSELAQVREYVPGDDVRLIDWNVTARTTVPHVRVHVAERVLTTWLVLDASPSMGFGTAERRKFDVAEGVALAIGHVATRHGNALGVFAFGPQGERVVPPAQGRAGLVSLLLALRMQPEPRGLGPGLGEVLRRANRLAGRGRLMVVVSDFRGQRDWDGPLLELCGRHEVIAVEIRDPREQELPDVGELWLVDPETGRHLRVDTGNRRLRERFAAAAAAEREEVAAAIRRAGARHVVLSTQGDWLRPLALGLRQEGVVR